MKNLTLEENIRRILLNSDTEYALNHNRNSIYGQSMIDGRAEWFEKILEVLQSTVASVRQYQMTNTHLYGLTTPQSLVSSDFGDVEKTIFVDDVPFNTLEGIKNELVDKLISGHEVYVYSINKVEMMTVTSLLPEVRYYMRYKCVHRNEWVEMIQVYEQDRLHRLQSVYDERVEWLNHWVRISDDTNKINNDYIEQPSNDSLINGKIKKFKF